METQTIETTTKTFVPWNKSRVTGQKPPLKPREVWAIRVRLQISNRVRDLALFNLAIDSKLRGCDLVHLRVEDVMQGDQVRTRALIAPAQDGCSSSVRDHRAGAGRHRDLGARKSAKWIRLAFPEQGGQNQTDDDAPVRPPRR